MKLLFICTHNACRSIVAEAIGRERGAGRLTVASAGSAPRGEVHPLTLKHLVLQGYDTAGLASKSWDELAGFAPDAVITVCDNARGEACPAWFGDTLQVHWGLADPTALDGDEEVVGEAFSDLIALLEHRIDRLLEVEAGSPQFPAVLKALGESD